MDEVVRTACSKHAKAPHGKAEQRLVFIGDGLGAPFPQKLANRVEFGRWNGLLSREVPLTKGLETSNRAV